MPRQSQTTGSNTAIEILKGAVAGAVGVWAMDKIREMFTERKDPESRPIERALQHFEEEDRSTKMVRKIADRAGYDLAPYQTNYFGQGTHYAFGVIPAAIYAARRKGPGFNIGQGLLFGVSSFLLKDELGSWMLGITGRPDEYPWETHLQGLVGYLGYGAAMEGTLAALDRGGEQAQKAASKARRQVEEKMKDRRAKRRSDRPASKKSEGRPPHV